MSGSSGAQFLPIKVVDAVVLRHHMAELEALLPFSTPQTHLKVRIQALDHYAEGGTWQWKCWVVTVFPYRKYHKGLGEEAVPRQSGVCQRHGADCPPFLFLFFFFFFLLSLGEQQADDRHR